MALAKLSPKRHAETGIEIAITHPETDIPIGVYVTVFGSDSEKYKEILRRQTNGRLEKAAKKGGRVKVTAEALDSDSLELLVGCTKSWRTELKERDDQGVEKITVSRPAEIELEEGEWLPCTPENVRRVFEMLPWFKEQVDQAIGDRANFLQS